MSEETGKKSIEKPFGALVGAVVFIGVWLLMPGYGQISLLKHESKSINFRLTGLKTNNDRQHRELQHKIDDLKRELEKTKQKE